MLTIWLILPISVHFYTTKTLSYWFLNEMSQTSSEDFQLFINIRMILYFKIYKILEHTMGRMKGHQGILLPDIVLEIWGPARPLAGACYGTLLSPSLSFLEPLLDAFLSSTCSGGCFWMSCFSNTRAQVTNFKHGAVFLGLSAESLGLFYSQTLALKPFCHHISIALGQISLRQVY